MLNMIFIIRCPSLASQYLQAVPYTFFRGNDDVNVNKSDRARAQDSFAEKIHTLNVSASKIGLPAALVDEIVASHSEEAGKIIAQTVLLEARRLHQWEDENANASISSLIALLLPECPEESRAAYVAELTTVKEQPAPEPSIQDQIQLAFETIKVILPGLTFNRGKNARRQDVVTLKAQSTSINPIARKLILSHIVCLRSIEINEATGELTAQLPVNVMTGVHSRKVNDCRPRVTDRLFWRQFTSAVVVLKAINFFVPTVFSQKVHASFPLHSFSKSTF